MRPCLAILLLSGLIANGANWYVDNRATGSSGNYGTNWSQAWTNFASIRFNKFSPPVIGPGDTLWISGGPVGGTNIYIGNIDDAGSSTYDGTSVSNITIRTGRDSTNSGVVAIWGYIKLARKYWIVDGAKDTNWIPSSILDTFYLHTNCNIIVSNSTVENSVYFQGAGSKVRWLNVSRSYTNDNAAIYVKDGDSADIKLGDGTEIAYCYIHDVDGFGVRGEFNYLVATNWGQLSVHHNFMERIADNFMQFPIGVDYHDNYHRDQEIYFNGWPTYAGHPDCIQEVSAFSRIWNNIFVNTKGSRFYVQANGELSHDIICFNNLWYSTTNWYGKTFTNRWSGTLDVENPGTGFDITGHDNELGQACNLSNIWIFNNTMLHRGTIGTPSGIIWNRGSLAGRPSGWASNIYAFNNAFIGMAPYNADPVMQFFTNQTTQNGITGFDYDANNVQVDYNSVNGFTGTGRGLVWGPKGNASPLDPYATMADFAAATAYKSNNNAVAAFVSFDPNRTNGLHYDFRPQVGDAALVGLGTNLTSITNFAPGADYDLLGNPRGTAWDIGAYQIPSGYWVATNGSDVAAGTFAAPWRTIQKAANTMTAGDVVNVTPGNYDEYVVTAASGTSESARIIFRAYPANDPLNPVETKQFRVKHRFITIEGFKISKAVGANGGMIRIDPTWSNVTITNNWISDSVYLRSRTADFGANYVHVRDAVDGVNFNAAGFVAGMSVFMGSDSLYHYTNVGPGLTVSNISADGLTMYFNQALEADSGTNYWVMIIAGSTAVSSRGVYVTGESAYPSEGCTNIVIAGNMFSNIVGCAVQLGWGRTNLVTRNTFTHLKAQYAMRIYSADSEVSYNLIKDSEGVLWWTTPELNDPSRPSGSDYYDWESNLTTAGGAGQTNVQFHHNWIQNVHNQMMEHDYKSTSGNYWFHHNVYVGVKAAGGASMNNITFAHNTFLRDSYDMEAEGVLQLGGKNSIETDYQQAQTNLTVVSNLFVHCGSHWNLSQEAPYAYPHPDPVTNGVYGSNYSVSAETMGWSNTIAPEGVFGAGDPLFVNIRDPLGPDGLPFTDDDGLRPLPSSTIALLGIGALTPHQIGSPFAHFSVAAPGPGWMDRTGTNYSAAWTALKPHERTDVIRNWQTPEALGSNSATVVFSAAQSVDGLSLTNTALVSYRWLFNGSNAVTLAVPLVTNTFTMSTNWVQLWVTNSAGQWATYSNAYRVINGSEEPPPPPAEGSGGRITSAVVQMGIFK